MRVLLQRATEARVDVDGQAVGRIGLGLLAFVGFGQGDGKDLPGSRAWATMLSKVLDLRIFPDEAGKLNRSLADVRGDLLVVSQFTLYADCRKGRRPSFTRACPPDLAQHLYHRFCQDLTQRAPGRIAFGEFGAEMHVAFTNWGPVTILLDSDELSPGPADVSALTVVDG